MSSPLPKVLHPVAGTPILHRIVTQSKAAGAKEIRVVVGHGEALVRQVVEPLGAVCLTQTEQNGTADAVRCADPGTLAGTVLIMNGDHPLINEKDFEQILMEYEKGEYDLAVVTCKLKNPREFGRVVRHQGKVRAIVETKDASSETLKINEVNTGIYVCDAKVLNELLPEIGSHNKQGEFYLTDIISLAHEKDYEVGGIETSPRVAMGVNTQAQLTKATQYIFQTKAKKLLEEGVILIDPKSTYVEESVEVGAGSVLYPGSYLRGRTKLGQFCVVEPQSMLINTVAGDSVQFKSGCYIEDSQIQDKATLGPYARVRANSDIGTGVDLGNFVEVKKSKIAANAKAKHLTYLGDAEVGEETNIGCGTITCNYAVDKKKYVTKIGKNVFVGSDVQFVAPVTVEDNSYVASGSTVTKEVPEGSLAIARGRQKNIHNYQPRGPQQKSQSSTSTPNLEK